MSRQRSIEVIQTSEYVTIGELVRLTGTRYSTLKFYTEEGFLPFEQKEERLTRRYPRRETVRRRCLPTVFLTSINQRLCLVFTALRRFRSEP